MNIASANQIEKNVRELFALGAHLGHKKNRLHPKARKYVYQIVNGVSIIDLTKTVNKLEQAKAFLTAQAKEGKSLLMVATKKIVNQHAANLCREHSIPFVSMKWQSGLLTNFQTIIKNVKKLQMLKDQKANGEWEKYVKHERMALDKHLMRLERFYGGLLTLTKHPDILFIIDSKKERNALIEAKSNNIPVVGIIDTNSDPDQLDFPIVLNDDSPVVLERVISELIQSYVKGKPQATV